MNSIPIVEYARIFAIERHGDQMYGNDLPYEWHIGHVAELATRLGYSAEIQAAAWLHDTIENTPTTLDELRTHFGDTIAEIVDCVTYIDIDKESGVDKTEKSRRNVGSHVLRFCDASVNFSASAINGARGDVSQWTATVDRYGALIAQLQPDLPTPAEVNLWLASRHDGK